MINSTNPTRFETPLLDGDTAIGYGPVVSVGTVVSYNEYGAPRFTPRRVATEVSTVTVYCVDHRRRESDVKVNWSIPGLMLKVPPTFGFMVLSRTL